MKTINNTKYGETYIEETLDNGLNVVIWEKKGYATTTCLFGTPYGSLDIKQIDEDKNIITYPAGSAHFLEHKLFESENGDILSEFTNLGASVNAFTSFNETVYYFNTTSKDIKKPLELLLDFVQDLKITDESVEKEKGIIKQELSMYLDQPNYRLYFETLKSLYYNHPLKIDVGGTHESVDATTKKDLEECYNRNYHPSNMHLVIVSSIDKNKLLKIVKENQSKKSFSKFKKLTRHIEKEPESVYRKDFNIKLNVRNFKTSYAIKLLPSNMDSKNLIKEKWCTYFILESYFSGLNSKYQSWIKKQEISSFFRYEENITKDASFIIFYDEGIAPDKFKNFVSNQLEKFKESKISSEQLELLKKSCFGNTLRKLNYPNEIGTSHFRNIQKNTTIFEQLNIIQSITIEDCNKLIESLDLNNSCTVSIS
ncbi:MAG: EF-P 5-aminopentanol modification-associated protein YfmH [Anaerorhabdus sp.]